MFHFTTLFREGLEISQPLVSLAKHFSAESTRYLTLTEVEVTKSKIYRLAYRFPVDFSLLGLAYGFLSQSPRFLFGNHKHFTKVLDFWFAVEI